MRIQVNKLGLTSNQSKPLCQYVAHFCGCCGSEIFGQWELGNLGTSGHEEIDDVLYLPRCPICNSELSRQKGFLIAHNTRPFDCFQGYGYWVQSSSDRWYRNFAENKEFCISIPLDLLNKAEYGGYDPFDSENNLDILFEIMKRQRKESETTAANDAVQSMLAQYEDSASTEIISGYTKIKEQPEDLKEYILKLIQTETSIHSLLRRLQVLYIQRIDADRSAYGSSLQPLTAAREEIKEAEDNLRKCKNTLTLLTSKTLAPIELPMPKRPQKPAEPQYEQPGLFNKKRILAQNAELKAQYEQACYQYECEMDRYDQELESRKQQIAQLTKQQEEQNRHGIEEAQRKIEEAEEKLAAAQKKEKDTAAASADLATPEKARKALLDSEIQQAEELLQKAIHCKHQLYNYNIIFEKYRNLVALSTIYEYLMAGRCTSLEGVNGAYNLYESELRANIIISQLNNVLESLEAIKENQYMIYSEIQKVNSSLRRLESTMETAVKSLSSIEVNTQTMTQYMEVVAKNSDVIAHNTAATAYYSKISAELTDALGYMVALR